MGIELPVETKLVEKLFQLQISDMSSATER